MKKIYVYITLVFLILSLAMPVSANSAEAQTELGQLKLCKSAGIGVTKGQVFTFSVDNTNYIVQAGYCVLAGQFPLNTQVIIKENIPAGYFVENIVIAPSDRTVSKSTALGEAVVKIGSGITEVTFRNATATSTSTKTPVPTTPQGYMQVCKQADGAGVSGYFMFRFAGQSRSVPADFCSSLVFNLTPGTLTVTEDARAGYEVSDIYTIPTDRLISKDLNARTATVTIVPSNGDASTQTVVVFVNKRIETATPPTETSTPPTGTATPPTQTSTPPTETATPPTETSTPPTGTATPPTETSTPPACQPIVIVADLSNVSVGQSIEGLGVIAPGLNIDAKGTAVKLLPNVDPFAYFSNTNGMSTLNGYMTSNGGFTDITTKNALQPHLYTFTFAPGLSISNFSLHMLDFGDWNPTNSANHYVSMTAYDALGNVVAKQELSYITPPVSLPASSDLYGNLAINGDASASPGQPGNWIWNISGNGLVKVVLEFGIGYDPNIAFDVLSFTTACP